MNITILGEPASKANSRQLVQIKGRPAFIKSKKARDYVAYAQAQLRTRYYWKPEPPTEPMRVTMHIYYASQRPDLDPSVILDVLQGFAFKNDRQVRELHLFHHIDKANPRAEIEVGPIHE